MEQSLCVTSRLCISQHLEIFKVAELIQAEAGVRRPKDLLAESQQKVILSILNEQSITNLDKVLALANSILLKSA